MKEQRKQEVYCSCNGCKTRRYGAAALLFNIGTCVGVWVMYFF